MFGLTYFYNSKICVYMQSYLGFNNYYFLENFTKIILSLLFLNIKMIL